MSAGRNKNTRTHMRQVQREKVRGRKRAKLMAMKRHHNNQRKVWRRWKRYFAEQAI